ncbi:MAG: hypothetical protein SYR96_35775 [Actinomycetota bacterium]|nr:hypothetical protein [Actinomycetota bacterium]
MISPVGTPPAGGDLDLRRTTHHLLRQITDLLENRRFNVPVARTMQLATAARRSDPADPATREAAEVLAVVMSLFTRTRPKKCGPAWATHRAWRSRAGP